MAVDRVAWGHRVAGGLSASIDAGTGVGQARLCFPSPCEQLHDHRHHQTGDRPREPRRRPDRHAGGGVDRHWRHGRRWYLLDPRRGGPCGRQCHVARLRDRRGRGAAVDLFLCEARRGFSLGGRRGALPGQGFRRRNPRRRPQPVHVGGLHHLARALRHGVRRLCRDLRDGDAVAAAAQIAGGRIRRRSHAGQCIRRQADGPLGNADRCDQGRHSRAVRRGRHVVQQAGQSVPGAVAGDEVGPVRGRRPVHRLRRLRPRDQCGRRHARPPQDAAARPLYQRDPGDRDLSRGFAETSRTTRSSAPRTTRWRRPRGRSSANSGSG